MDLRGGPPLKQQEDFEIQGLCVPSTPAKTIETRRPLEFSPSYSQRSQPSEGCCWLDSAEGVSTAIQDATPPQGHPLHNGSYSTSGISDFLRVLTGSQAAEGAFACQATSSSSFMPQEPTTSCGNVTLMDPWSQNLCGNGFDASSDAGVSEILSLAPFCAPNGHGQEMPASQNNLLLHGNVLLTGSFCNISSSSNCSIWPGQKVQYEPTDDCHPNLNSFPEITICSAETLAVPNSLTPMATEKYSQRIQDEHPSLKVIDLVDEGSREDNLQRKGSCSSHMAMDKPADASFSNLMDSLQHSSFKNPECANNMVVLSHEFSDQLVGNEMSITERENDAIDLNDASKQKPKRRKHRPKVIKERKPSRTPKPLTPMPKTPKSTGDKQRASGKRKYVRRKNTTPSTETTLNGLRNIVEPESRNQAKPVRRNLKFDLEEAQTFDKHSLLMSYFMQRLENHAQEACMDGSLTSPRLKETVDSTELQGPVVENSLAGIVFTLNNSKTQPQNEYLKILQTPLTSMGNQNVRASNEGVNSNSISDAAIIGTKRAHCGILNAHTASKRNLMHSHYVANCACESHDAGKQGSCFLDNCKRMKKQKGCSGATPNPSLELIFTPSAGWKCIQASNNPHDFTFSNAQAFEAQEKLQISCEKADDYIHSHHLQGNDLTSFSRFIDSNMNSSPFKLCMQKNMGISHPSTPNKPFGYSNSQESKDRGMLAQLEKSDVNKPVKTKGKRGRKKREENPLVNPLSSSIIVGDSPKQTSPVITSTISRYLHEENLLLEVNSVNCQDTSNYNVSTNIRLSSGPLAPYMNPVDDIVQKLSHLSINRDHEVAIYQAPSAIVPYVGDGGMMVPYKDLAKRRRPRSKVDLDPETNRVWKLLMGKECGEDGANEDKEKWWEEERRVFQGRVDSFIARMHLVQGDRRFSQWKGSVVDSVIGVFLTQNVSDHLSSSAFMALAARFPLRSRGNSRSSNAEKLSTTTENHSFCCQGSLEVNAAENEGKEENSSSNETLGIGIIGSSSVGYFKEKSMELHDSEASFCHGSPNIESGTEVGATRSVSSVEVEDRRLEEVVSSQNFVVPLQDSMGCQVHSVDHIRSNSFFNIEAEDLSTGSVNNGLAGSSFTNLMQIAESSKFQKLFSSGVGRILTTESNSVYSQMTPDIGSNLPALNQLDNFEGTCQSHKTDSTHQHAQFGLLSMLPGPHLCHFLNPSNLTSMENNANTLKEEIRSNLPSTTRETNGTKIEVLYHESTESKPENLDELGSLNKPLSTSRTACTIDSYLLIGTQSKQNVAFSETELGTGQYSFSPKNLAERTNVSSNSENSHECSILQPQDEARFRQKDEHSISKEKSPKDAFRVQDQMVNSTNSKITSAWEKKLQNRLDMAETFGSNMKYEGYNFQKVSSETPKEGERIRRKRAETEKNTYDWNSLRKEVYHNKPTKERSSDTMDSLDWEAVRCAPVSEIAETIRERGMNNVLAERIKEFLNRLVKEHGSIDLEWLRDIPPDKSKDYLLSIRGLGLKSTECVRLLTLHHLAFPVDTNVGRICVRLGWVPLQPLPESLQLHLLELYPVLETIQKYLWPRLCKLDQRTLYELHYQMITFGKVFCTKSKPNCNSCPMRGECRHFASAFASARLALPAPEDKSIVCSTYPIASENDTAFSSTRSIPQIECSSLSQERRVQKNCEPIIEEPATPEPECRDALESAIEDAFFEDPDEIPMIKLNFEKFAQNLQNFMQEKMELPDGDMSKALVALTPEAASIPMPKLKNVSRLRTEHQVYEIPDSHPLLEGLDTREPDDPCPYLLAIWTPGETAQSTELPEVCCNAEGASQLCDRSTCFACNSTRESQAHKVRGTLLIPCRTAMKGSFPLNGTYFQVNEVFADHHSSRNPIDVPRDWIWNLPRRMVCFGTSIPTIFRGLSTEGIQQCFWRGFVCVRGFDRDTRAPKPLFARLHFPASKAPKSRKGAALLQGQKNRPKSPQTKLESIVL